MIAVIDYGAGNLKSITNALDFLRVKYKVTGKAEDIEKADRIIFPGVGAFGNCIKALRKKGLLEPLKKEINKKPYLGICLGLQVLFEESEESPGVKGLSIFEGKCKKFTDKKLKIPQIGWNSIKIIEKNSSKENKFSEVNLTSLNKLLKNIKDYSYFYFVHSYYVNPKNKKIILTKTDYGVDFASSIGKGKIFGVQFHPERSGSIGLKMLENFVKH